MIYRLTIHFEARPMRTINRIGQSNGLFLLLLLPVLLLLSYAPRAFAQASGTASVQGTVTDSTGAAVGAATVTLTQTATGTSRTTTTDRQGIYALPNIPVGPYSLAVTASGFQSFTQTGVLEVGNNI